MTSARNNKKADQPKITSSTKALKKMVERPPDEVINTYRSLLANLNEGLPRASSGEVLNSRVNW